MDRDCLRLVIVVFLLQKICVCVFSGKYFFMITHNFLPINFSALPDIPFFKKALGHLAVAPVSFFNLHYRVNKKY